MEVSGNLFTDLISSEWFYKEIVFKNSLEVSSDFNKKEASQVA